MEQFFLKIQDEGVRSLLLALVAGLGIGYLNHGFKGVLILIPIVFYAFTIFAMVNALIAGRYLAAGFFVVALVSAFVGHVMRDNIVK